MHKVPFILSLSTDITHIDKLLKEYNILDTYTKHIFWGNEPLPAQFWKEISLISLFSNPQVLILRHAEKISKENYLAIDSYLKNINTMLFIIFSIESETIPKWIENLFLYTKAKENNWIHIQGPLTRKTIKNFIQQYCQKQNITIDTKAVLYLQNTLPLSSIAIQNEIDKLHLITENSHIDITLVEQASAYVQEHTIWEVINSLLTKKLDISFWNESLLNTSFFSLSAILQKELKVFACILTGDSISLSPYIRTIKENQAKLFSLQKITDILSLLFELEQNIKLGNTTEEQSVEYLLCTLYQKF